MPDHTDTDAGSNIYNGAMRNRFWKNFFEWQRIVFFSIYCFRGRNMGQVKIDKIILPVLG